MEPEFVTLSSQELELKYRSLDTLIGHSALHGGPPFYGISKSAVHFWSSDNFREETYTIELEDVNDIQLREIVEKVNKG